MEENTKNNWYDKKTVVFILIVLFFPVGLYALWKSSTFSKKAKGIITGVVAVLLLTIGAQQDRENKQPLTNKTGPSRDVAAAEKTKKLFSEFVTEQAALKKYRFDELLKDPGYQEWVEIEKQFISLKKDPKWLNKNKKQFEETLKLLRNPLKKWCPNSNKIDMYLERLNQYEKGTVDERVFTQIREDLDYLEKNIRDTIVERVCYKSAVGLQIPTKNIEKLVSSFGFTFQVNESWDLFCGGPWAPDYRFYQDGEVKKNKKTGKGPAFSFKYYYDQDHEKLIRIIIPFDEIEADYMNIPDDPDEKWDFWRRVFQRTISKPIVWLGASLDLVFNDNEKLTPTLHKF